MSNLVAGLAPWSSSWLAGFTVCMSLLVSIGAQNLFVLRQGIRREPRAVLRKFAGKHFVEMPESEWCCGGAGAYAFSQPELSGQVLDRKLRNIVSVQPQTVIVGGTSCLIQIGAGLKAAYPSAKAEHYSVFLERKTAGGS